MRNLKILKDYSTITVSNAPISASVWDAQNDAIIFTLGPYAETAEIELRRTSFANGGAEGSSLLIAAWEAPCPLPDLAFDRVLDLHYFPENGTTCLVLIGGDVIIVRDEPLPEQAKIEIVGSVEGGIAAAAWSPDEEILAIATRQHTFLFMTIEFESIASIPLTSEDVKLSKHVSVGWGKSETQFKGKRAKALRDPTIPEKVDQGVLSPFDQKGMTISWRGDGAYVAVNAVIEQVSRRMIRVFNREGILESVTEPVDGLEGALSWRPAGNLIAGVQRLNSEANVIFFERNGLRHGQFSLRLSANSDDETLTSPIALAWNVLSTALAVTYQNHVQVWTMSNYHYYLKQDISSPFYELQLQPLVLSWHPEDSMRLSISGVTTSLADKSEPGTADCNSETTKIITRDIQLVLNTTLGPRATPNDQGLAVVIDGENLRITPLRIANVPPPMSLHEIKVAAVKDVAIDATNSSLAALHQDSVSIVSLNQSSQEPKLTNVQSLHKSSTQTALQISNLGHRYFVLLQDFMTRSVSLYDVASSAATIISTSQQPLIYHLTGSVNQEALYLLEASDLFRCYSSSNLPDGHKVTSLQKEWVLQFPTTAPISRLEVLHYKEDVFSFGLTPNGALYANHRQLLNNCTSFLVTSSHLIVTTTNHLLKFIHITDLQDLEVPSDQPETDERCRIIERGARLVTVMPTTFSLVLQMPRGNLETIYPRALVLASVRQHLDARRYRKAFSICRSQRVDMNILHDYAPKQFLEDVDLFVKQIQSVEYIDLFLSQLRNEDVSHTMYKETIPKQLTNRDTRVTLSSVNEHATSEPVVAQRPAATGTKVNQVCDAFLSVLKTKYATNVQNLITANVCKVPPNLEAGLRVAAELRERERELSEAAVEHICFLVDVNRVYESALGLYDLDVALLVAQQSQKDPREYLPYLQNLQNMSPLRKKFAIDNDLKKHQKALGHLHDIGDFEEFKSYTQKYELYKEALEMNKYDIPAAKSLTRIYADFLNEQRSYKEAAIAYESLSDFTAASEAYRTVSLWQESLATAALIPLADDKIRSLAKSLAEQLASTKDFNSSAIIHLDYLDDAETSVLYFCKSYKFSTAIRTAARRKHPELLTKVIDPALIEASGTLTELLADCKAQLNAQVPRIEEVRRAKAMNPLAFFSGEVEGNADIPDDISVAASETSTTGGASLFTRYTQKSGLTNTVATGASRRTSKNRRREERKRARGKKGSVYEEEYLVNSVRRLIERVNDTADDVRSTVEGLLRRDMRERAQIVENSMVEIVNLCGNCLTEVFEASKPATASNDQAEDVENEENVRPTGADGVVWDRIAQAKATSAVPIVKPYQQILLTS